MKGLVIRMNDLVLDIPQRYELKKFLRRAREYLKAHG